MKTKKYWVLPLVLIGLFIITLGAETTKRNIEKNQWEYGRYFTIYEQVPALGKTTQSFAWADSSSSKQVFTSEGETAKDLWRKVGFDFGKLGYKKVSITDWFNWLGKQGWELVCIDAKESSQLSTKERTYWFRRPK